MTLKVPFAWTNAISSRRTQSLGWTSLSSSKGNVTDGPRTTTYISHINKILWFLMIISNKHTSPTGSAPASTAASLTPSNLTSTLIEGGPTWDIPSNCGVAESWFGWNDWKSSGWEKKTGPVTNGFSWTFTSGTDNATRAEVGSFDSIEPKFKTLVQMIKRW